MDYRVDVQSALDFPRVFHDGNTCAVERGMSTAVRDQLTALSHKVVPTMLPYGGTQAIWIGEDNCLVGGQILEKMVVLWAMRKSAGIARS